MKHRSFATWSWAVASLLLGCGSVDDAGLTGPEPVTPCTPDESAARSRRPMHDRRRATRRDRSASTWIKVEIPGTVCGNGSQYKFFVNYSSSSNNLVVAFEPGGACWDYASCAGVGGIRGAANPHGIPDDHMSTYQYLNLLRRTDVNPASELQHGVRPVLHGRYSCRQQRHHVHEQRTRRRRHRARRDGRAHVPSQRSQEQPRRHRLDSRHVRERAEDAGDGVQRRGRGGRSSTTISSARRWARRRNADISSTTRAPSSTATGPRSSCTTRSAPHGTRTPCSTGSRGLARSRRPISRKTSDS